MVEDMRKRIISLRVSDHVSFFEDGLRRMWGFLDKCYPEHPCVFFGCYGEDDARAINAHTGLRLIWPSSPIQRMDLIKPHPDNWFICTDEDSEKIGVKGLNVKHIRPVVKDFSAFTPCEPGEKMYIYLGNGDEDKFRINELNQFIYQNGSENFILGRGLGLSEEECIEKLYKPSFVNIRMNPTAGMTSALEMSLMGRATVEFDEVKKHKHFAKRMIQGLGMGSFPHKMGWHYSDDWLYTDYYK
jgi:hypothetical protein